MSRRFTLVTLALTAVVAFLVGAIVAGGFVRPSVGAQATPSSRPPARSTISAPARTALSPLVNFVEVVDRVNPAVVNVDATSAGPAENRRRRMGFGLPDPPDMFDGPRRDGPKRRQGAARAGRCD